jgi:hypothetical protein
LTNNNPDIDDNNSTFKKGKKSPSKEKPTQRHYFLGKLSLLFQITRCIDIEFKFKSSKVLFPVDSRKSAFLSLIRFPWEKKKKKKKKNLPPFTILSLRMKQKIAAYVQQRSFNQGLM